MFHSALNVLCVVAALAVVVALCSVASVVVYGAIVGIIDHQRGKSRAKEAACKTVPDSLTITSGEWTGVLSRRDGRDPKVPDVEPVGEDPDALIPFDGCICQKCEQARSNLALAADQVEADVVA